MVFGRTDKDRTIALFVDGSNMFFTSKALGWDLDWIKVLNHYKSRYTLLRAYYYTAMPDTGNVTIRPLVDFLNYNGWTVVTKPSKDLINSEGAPIRKGNMDCEITVDMLKLVLKQRLNEVVLFSGDGDFKYLLNAVKEEGVYTTVVSTAKTRPPMVADELRRAADELLELSDLQQKWKREYESREKARTQTG